MCKFGAHMRWRTSMMTHRPGRLDKCLLTITKNRVDPIWMVHIPREGTQWDVGHGRERKTGGKEREKKKKGRRAGGMGMGRREM